MGRVPLQVACGTVKVNADKTNSPRLVPDFSLFQAGKGNVGIFCSRLRTLRGQLNYWKTFSTFKDRVENYQRFASLLKRKFVMKSTVKRNITSVIF